MIPTHVLVVSGVQVMTKYILIILSIAAGLAFDVYRATNYYEGKIATLYFTATMVVFACVFVSIILGSLLGKLDKLLSDWSTGNE